MQSVSIIYKSPRPKQSETNEILNLIPSLTINSQKDFIGTDIITVSNPEYNGIKTLDWNWFNTLFGVYDIRVLVLGKNDLKKAGIKEHWGWYFLDADKKHQFYMTYLPNALDPRAKANGFLTNFAWMFCHEYLHGCRWSETKNKQKAAQDVHDWEAQGKLKYYLALYNVDYDKKTILISLYEKLVAFFTLKKKP